MGKTNLLRKPFSFLSILLKNISQIEFPLEIFGERKFLPSPLILLQGGEGMDIYWE